jgi:hypothetical protein
VWELVAPPERHGARIEPIGENAPVQAAADGGAIAYATNGSIEAAAEGNRSPEASSVISTHGAGGWSSRDIATANETATEGYINGNGNEYRLFSSDLSTAWIAPLTATPPTAEPTLYLRHGNGSIEALVTAANVEAGAHFGGALSFAGATPDLAHIALGSSVSLVHNAGPGLYEWSGGHLQFVGAGGLAGSRGAISNSGTRIFWSEGGHLYMFDAETESSVQLDTVQPQAGHGSPGASFQDASAEGTRAFFTDSQELTPGASEGSLYEYDAETSALSDLTIPVNTGKAWGCRGFCLASQKTARTCTWSRAGCSPRAQTGMGKRPRRALRTSTSCTCRARAGSRRSSPRCRAATIPTGVA